MTKAERSAFVTFADACVTQLRMQCPLLVGGQPCSPRNRQQIVDCVEAWLFLTEDLMLRLDISESGRRARLTNFVNELCRQDFVDVLETLESIYAYLIRYDPCLETFKQFQDIELSAGLDLGRLLSPINLPLHSFLVETDSVSRAKLLVLLSQFLRYPRKLELESIGLEEQAIADYLTTEEELDHVDFDNEDTLDILEGISRIVGSWFSDFEITDLLPQHGPGSVAEGPLDQASKFAAAKVDPLLRILLSSASFPEAYREFFPIQPSEGLVRTSRTVFVPKTATKLRTISMEPATLQYIQQGVMRELYRYIESHPYLGVHVKLADQTQNQVWALVGSISTNTTGGTAYCTIDLSHASDSVSWELARRVFSRTPKLYKWLLGTRSRKTVLPNGEEIVLKKFAPMGSALCFPIECIVFSAIVEYSSRRMRASQPRWLFEPFWSVYGDDIIVSRSLYEDVVNILTRLGFQTNRTKSFCDGCYRESCGREYYAGVDITPLYYRIPYSTHISPSVYSSWCAAANNGSVHRLPLFRWFFIQKILRFSRRLGPYFTQVVKQTPMLYSPNPTNFHVKSRWNKNYQRLEGRFLSVKSRPRSEECTDDTLAYFCKLVEMAGRRSLKPRDEPPSLHALSGVVEFFSSTRLPVTPHCSLSEIEDWIW